MCDRFIRDLTQTGKVTRRFTFLKQNTYSRSFFVNVCQFLSRQEVILSNILLHLAHKGLPIKNFSFQFQAFNLVVEAGDKVTLPLDLFIKEKQYKIRMTKTADSEEERSDQAFKKPREPERVIRDVIYKLKKWRLLHERCNYSLTNAARQIEVQKKTLDDYYFAIRVGQMYGYDFSLNLNKKIGDLREFIRGQNTKIKGKVSTTIHSFELVPEPDLSEYETREDSRWLDEIWEDQTFVPYIPENL